MDKTEETIAANVLRRRKALGYSQESLAELASVSYHTVWRIEAGQQVRRPSLKKVAKALGCTDEELMGISDQVRSPTVAELLQVIKRQEEQIEQLSGKFNIAQQALLQQKTAVDTTTQSAERPPSDRLVVSLEGIDETFAQIVRDITLLSIESARRENLPRLGFVKAVLKGDVTKELELQAILEGLIPDMQKSSGTK